MQAKEGIIDRLNQVLTLELTATNQYFLAAKQCESWGFSRLHHYFRKLSMSEMKDVEELMERIIFLDGLPNMQRLNQVRVGQSVPEILEAGLALELGAIDLLRGGIEHAARVGDFATRAKFEEMTAEEETHADWFETQLQTIQLVGLENYLAQQMGDSGG
jgi:bacterioferritin